MAFREIKPDEIKDNLIKAVRDEWMLISVGNEQKHNMMTASWGFFGEMWGKDCAIAAIRPTRYTFSLTEENDCFALCFMGDNRDCHKVCGSESGRDIDKVEKTGLTPVFNTGTMYFEEARLVLIVKKMYSDFLHGENFCDKATAGKWYNNDYHKLYFGEIVKVLEKV